MKNKVEVVILYDIRFCLRRVVAGDPCWPQPVRLGVIGESGPGAVEGRWL